MRRRLAFLLVLAICISVSPRTTAVSPDCSQVICGAYCITHDYEFGGLCNWGAPSTTGCVQLNFPDCASMSNTYCCKPISGGSSF